MASVTVATVAKKVAAALASNKKGRKIIGYVIGIAFFILCIPVFVLISLFGPLSNIDNDLSDSSDFAYQFSDSKFEKELKTVEEVFSKKGLSEADIHKAQWISLCFLLPRPAEDVSFYERLTACFLKANEDNSIYDLLESEFEIEINEDDRNMLEAMYNSNDEPESTVGGEQCETEN